ncbi:hypothetical protein [Trichothermofontia sp.]
MFQKLWHWLQQLWQRWFGRHPAAAVAPPAPIGNAAPARSEAEYEALFLALLDNPELTSGRFKGWLISKNLTETELTVWLHHFGDRLRDNPEQHQELAQRLIHFGTIVNGPTAQAALQLGKQIYIPPPEPEAGEWDVIEAIFKGDPLGH